MNFMVRFSCFSSFLPYIKEGWFRSYKTKNVHNQEMLFINVPLCRYITFYFVLKNSHRSISVDFISLLWGRFRAFWKVCLHLLKAFGDL